MALLSRLAIAAFGLSSVAWALAPGEAVPDFSAVNQDGKTITLKALKGKPIVIYFYPADETPGCTKQACNFRDMYANFRKLGATVLGVSSQSEKSHREFRKHHGLPFDLLIDPDGTLAEKLGAGMVPVVRLHKRQSLLIGKDGRVIRFYPDANPDTNPKEMLQDLEQALSGGHSH